MKSLVLGILSFSLLFTVSCNKDSENQSGEIAPVFGVTDDMTEEEIQKLVSDYREAFDKWKQSRNTSNSIRKVVDTEEREIEPPESTPTPDPEDPPDTSTGTDSGLKPGCYKDEGAPLIQGVGSGGGDFQKEIEEYIATHSKPYSDLLNGEPTHQMADDQASTCTEDQVSGLRAAGTVGIGGSLFCPLFHYACVLAPFGTLGCCRICRAPVCFMRAGNGALCFGPNNPMSAHSCNRPAFGGVVGFNCPCI